MKRLCIAGAMLAAGLALFMPAHAAVSDEVLLNKMSESRRDVTGKLSQQLSRPSIETVLGVLGVKERMTEPGVARMTGELRQCYDRQEALLEDLRQTLETSFAIPTIEQIRADRGGYEETYLRWLLQVTAKQQFITMNDCTPALNSLSERLATN